MWDSTRRNPDEYCPIELPCVNMSLILLGHIKGAEWNLEGKETHQVVSERQGGRLPEQQTVQDLALERLESCLPATSLP